MLCRRTALGWLRSHLSEPIQPDLLAQVSGVRPWAHETHFKMFLGATPLGWVRRMRLAHARHALALLLLMWRTAPERGRTASLRR